MSCFLIIHLIISAVDSTHHEYKTYHKVPALDFFFFLKLEQAKYICFTGTKSCVSGKWVFVSSVNTEGENLSILVSSQTPSLINMWKLPQTSRMSWNFVSIKTFLHFRLINREDSDFSLPSVLSMKSEQSMDLDLEFSREPIRTELKYVSNVF